jgi:methyltransferase-like protein/SAM-dependent methyltransferase
MDDAVDQVRAEYDEVPYESHAFPQTAPGHLAAVAHLFGLDVPDVSTARVLEIGCSTGGNLIPFAAWHPGATVVGIDLSDVQIDIGRERVQQLGIDNLTLLQGDIAAADLTALGHFDFVICHGVYSWVPTNVQEAILAAFRTLLTPNGVAFISYNVYPGWKAKEIVRDAMLLRSGGRQTAGEKLSFARGMIDFIAEVASPDTVLARAVADFTSDPTHGRDDYVLHEFLETFNSPCYFLEFGERAEPHGLGYLGDAAPHLMFAGNYGDAIAAPLLKECGHSQILVEQYLDFFVNRAFRQSLLVHGERGAQVRYDVDRTRFGRLHFAAWLPPIDATTRLDDSRQEYGTPDRAIFTQDPGVKAAVDALSARWPWTLSRNELLEAVGARLGAAGVALAVDQEEKLDELLEVLIMRGLARYRLDPVLPEPAGATLHLDEPLRRWAGLAGVGNISNPWHEDVDLTLIDKHLLPLLDGTRDGDELKEELLFIALADLIRFERDGERLTDDADIRAAVAEHVDALPQRLQQMRLLRLS